MLMAMLGALCLIGNYAACADSEQKWETPKYKFDLKNYGEIWTQEKKVIDHIGYFGMNVDGKTVNVIPDFSKAVEEKEESGSKLLVWKGEAAEHGVTVTGKLSVLPNKISWTVITDCAKALPAALYSNPRLFYENPEVFLGAEYEAVDIDGKKYSGVIPKEIEKNKWPQFPAPGVNLKEMVIRSSVGKLTFRVRSEAYQIEPFNIRGARKDDGSFDIRLCLTQFAKEAMAPAGYSNEMKMEIEFE